MYLQKIHIQNVKLIRDLELTFPIPAAEKPGWTVLIGRNGRGKTTILHAIALAAAGATDTLGGFVAASFPPRTVDSSDAPHLPRIEASFVLEPPPKRGNERRKQPQLEIPGHQTPITSQKFLVSTVSLRTRATFFDSTSHLSGYEDAPASSNPSTDPLRDARSLQLPHWMVAGYGVARHLRYRQSAPTPPASRHIERLRSLFTPDALLTEFGFLDVFKNDKNKQKKFNALLKDLVTKTTELLPELVNVELRGRGGVRAAASFVSPSLDHLISC